MMILLAAASLSLFSAMPQASIVDLGLAPNGELPEIVDMSADGTAACGWAGVKAFYWTEFGGFTFLPPSPLLGDDPILRCMSDDGLFVAGELASYFNVTEAFRWSQAGGYELLPAVSGQAGIELASAFGLNGDGSITTGTTYHTDLDQPAIWDVTGTGSVLEVPAPAGYGLGRDLSEDGQVAVGGVFGLGFDSLWGVRWVTGQPPIILLPPAGVFGAEATAVSRDGLVSFGTGFVDTSFDSLTGFLRWNAAGDVEFIDGLFPNTIRVQPSGADRTGTAVVGSYELDITGFSERSFYWSETTGFQTAAELAAANGLTLPGSIYRIRAISSDGNALAVRGWLPSTTQTRSFILRLSPNPGTEISSLDCAPANVNSTGTWAKLAAFGSATLTDEDVELRATDLPQGSFGMYLASMTPDMVPVFGGSSGTLCLGGSVGRFDGPGQVLRASVLGRTLLRIDLGGIPQPTGPVAALPGSEWFFQYWYRDNAGQMSTSNFSESCSVVFQ